MGSPCPLCMGTVCEPTLQRLGHREQVTCPQSHGQQSQAETCIPLGRQRAATEHISAGEEHSQGPRKISPVTAACGGHSGQSQETPLGGSLRCPGQWLSNSSLERWRFRCESRGQGGGQVPHLVSHLLYAPCSHLYSGSRGNAVMLTTCLKVPGLGTPSKEAEGRSRGSKKLPAMGPGV